MAVAARALAGCAALLLLGSGCGGSPSGARLVHDDAAAVVAAVNARDPDTARTALNKLDRDLAAAGQLDQLDPATVTALRASVSRLFADLSGLGAGLTPVVTPSPRPSPTPLPSLVPPRTRKKHHDDHG